VALQMFMRIIYFHSNVVVHFWINGKGAAHDADIIMNPPIQMPFAYPTQLLFECKAYGTSANLPIVRNALGLRNDLNDFEIVTRDTLYAYRQLCQ
jgi:hypothetical protein